MPPVGLVREPFVGVTDKMLDVAIAHLSNATQGFLAVFSASHFPDAQIAGVGPRRRRGQRLPLGREGDGGLAL
jgi:hypothetical protein